MLAWRFDGVGGFDRGGFFGWIPVIIEGFLAHSPSFSRQSAAGGGQICERKQRKHLRAIPGDAAIAHLAIAELALHDTEHVLHFGAHFAEAAIAHLLSLAELTPRLRLLLDRPQHAGVFGRALLLVAGVALVAVDRAVVLADQASHHPGVVDAARRHARRVHKPALGIDTDVRFHAEIPLVSLL